MRSFFCLCILISWSVACKKQTATETITLFTLLTPDQTNIRFSNDLTYSEDFNPYTYRNFYNGGGVGLGDINNDGLLDVFFCGNQVDSKLYLNKGNFRFEDITEKAGVACHGVWASGISFVDINGDGWQDLYICKSGKPGGAHRNNELFINQGDLTFKEQATAYGLATTGLSSHAAFFDYDRDGDLDCYLLNNSIRTVGGYDLRKDLRMIPDSMGGNKFFRNEGGRFINYSKEAGIYTSAIGFGLGVSIGDLNGDSWPDMYISNDFFERDYMYINQQNGRFKEQLEQSMPEISLNSMGADIADINNDALPEVFVTDMLPESNERYKTKTTFENWEKYQRNVQNGYHHQFIRNALQLNRGHLQFTEISRYAGVAATDWSWGALIVDFDLDGYKDIFVANGIYKDLTDQDYLNLYNDPETILGLMKKEKDIIKKLIDAIPSEKLPNYAFHHGGKGNLKFSKKAKEWGLDQPGFSNGSAYGDLDNDGDHDLVVNNTNMPAFIYRNNAIEQHQAQYVRFNLQGDTMNTKAIGTAIHLFQGDEILYQEVQPMRGFESCVDPRPLFGLGSRTKIDSVKVVWPTGKIKILHQVAANQTISLSASMFDDEAKFQVSEIQNNTPLVHIEGLDFVHIENVFNDFERDRLMFHMMSREGPALAIADVNGDRRDDIFFGNSLDQPSALFIQNKGGTFYKKPIPAFTADKGSEDTDAVFFDADMDGDQDLYVCSGGNELPRGSSLLADRLYLNNGKGEFSKSEQILPTFNFESTSCVRPADYDGDGDQDLFVGVRLIPFNYGVPANGYVLNNNGKGIFTIVETPALTKMGLITDATWQDIDQDKDLDLIICGEWMPVQILKNNNRMLEKMSCPGLDSIYGLWQTVKVYDMDNDGDQDILAGNWGLNSRIYPKLNSPTQLYINDFDQNGNAEQILTTYVDGISYPLTLRQDLVSQMPYLKKKYLSFKNYKNQGITDMFEPTQLKHSIQLTTTNHATGIFIQEEGNFRFEALPFEAQLSPVFAIEILHHEKKLPHLVLGGNFGGVKPELGSYVGNGLTLFSQNDPLVFTASKPILLEDEVRNLGLVTVENQKYLVIAVNNGPAKVVKLP